jgi:hypothetical protein
VTLQVILQVLVQLAAGQQRQQQGDAQQQQHQQLFVTSCEAMAGLYRYLLQQLQLAQQQATAAAAATISNNTQQQQVLHHQQLQQQVQGAFQRYPLVWLPDSVDAADNDNCSGRFYHLQQLCLSDPSGDLEQLACQQLAAAAAAGDKPQQAGVLETRVDAVMRPVLLHYAAVGQLFSDWLATAPTTAAAAAAEQHEGPLQALLLLQMLHALCLSQPWSITLLLCSCWLIRRQSSSSRGNKTAVSRGCRLQRQGLTQRYGFR